MNRSELWNSVSSERMKWTVAGFKSHLTRNLKKARTSRQKAAVKDFWENKIQSYIDMTRAHNAAVKRHNAAVKANATRKAAKTEKTRHNACKRVVRTVSR